MNKYKADLRVCFCQIPIPSLGSREHVINFAQMIQQVVGNLYIICNRQSSEKTTFNENVNLINIKTFIPYFRESSRFLWLSPIIWSYRYIAAQIEMSYNLIRISNKYDIVIFHEMPHYVLPAIVAKVLRKKIIKYMPSKIAGTKTYNKKSLDYFGSHAFSIIEYLVHKLSDQIIVPTEGNIDRFGMGKFSKKISVAMYTPIGDNFREEVDWNSRGDLIGYIGRLMDIKGSLQLAQAIPLILKKREARFLIIGDGPLMNEMKRHLEEADCLDRVEFAGWIPHEMAPDYFNKMKFHILPSFFDYPGTVNLEAMACGTVAISNNVGGAPDIINDYRTGFLLQDNDPQTIADKVIEIWDSPELDKIRENAHFYIDSNYRNEAMVETWKQILNKL